MQQTPGLPDEIWERIFSFLFPLGPEIESVLQTSVRFQQIMARLMARRERQFNKKMKLKSKPSVHTTRVKLSDSKVGPTPRYAHSSAMLNGILYIFGGFSDKDTAFNDLWRFNTHGCTWERIICTRTPRPKGNALMLAFQSDNMLILTGGRPPQMHTNVPMQLPAELNSNELDILNMSPIVSQKSNHSKILCRDWRPLQPLNRPLGRFNAAGCVLESMRIMILDGGSIQNANHEENQSTFILDMDKASPTSWIWSSRVIQEGFELPEPRSLHHCCPLNDDSVIMTDVTSPVPQFVHCNVTAIEPDIEIRQKNRQFKLFFTLIKLSIQPSIRLPFYLQGAQIHIQDQILYWISPVSKGPRWPSGNSMSIFRIKIESDSEAVLLENSLPLMLGPFEYPPCLIGHSLGQAKNGLLVFGGAVLSDHFVNGWMSITNITSKPASSNALLFLQFN